MKKHVLLIEDDRNQLDIFMDAINFNKVPCKCTYVQKYDHALKMLEYLQPDCIFIRIDLAGQDAIQLLKGLKSNQRLQSTHIVMYSDNLTSAVIKDAICQGADFCISKPTGAGDLQRLLTEIFMQQSPLYKVRNN
jgi:DNA-binding NarL/FixJ family response regulator